MNDTRIKKFLRFTRISFAMTYPLSLKKKKKKRFTPQYICFTTKLLKSQFFNNYKEQNRTLEIKKT